MDSVPVQKRKERMPRQKSIKKEWGMKAQNRDTGGEAFYRKGRYDACERPIHIVVYYEDRSETNVFLCLDGGSLGGGLGKYP